MQDEFSSAEHFILCVNSGSSSLKFALYSLDGTEEVRVAHGAVERIGLPDGRLWIEGKDNVTFIDVRRDFPDFITSAEGISAAVKNLGLPRPDAAGHRIVHGGPNHSVSERVDATLVAELQNLIPFAPLHLPSAIKGIEAVRARFP